eukprot:14780607-Alexandrium_andersonii.AAC.1
MTGDGDLATLVAQMEAECPWLLWHPDVWSAANRGRKEHEYKVPKDWPGDRKSYVAFMAVAS